MTLVRAAQVSRDAFVQERKTPVVTPVKALSARESRLVSTLLPLLASATLALAPLVGVDRAAAGLLAVSVVGCGAIAVFGPHVWGRLRHRPSPPPPAGAGLSVMVASLLPAVAMTAGASSPVMPLLLALAVALGSLVQGNALALLAPSHATALIVTLWTVDAPPLSLVHAALLFIGFALLGRALLFGTLRAVALREEARIDAELLQLYDDARLFRLVGPVDGASDDAEERVSSEIRRVVSQTLSVRDGFYRLLRLGSRALRPDSIALYLLDAAGKELVLKEQLLEVDGENAARISATRGALGLAIKKKAVVRILVDGDREIAPHRHGADSLLVVPLRERGEVRGVLVVDRERTDPFLEDEETFAVALVEEVLELSRTERILDDLDVERQKKTRVFAAARAFGGVVRTADAVEMALKTVLELGPLVAVAFLELWIDGPRSGMRVVSTAGPKAALLSGPASGTLEIDDDTWVGRAIVQRTALPHVALADVGSERGVLEANDGLGGQFGDLRAVPLFALGSPVGVLVVATAPHERLKHATLDALTVVADLAGVAIGGARHFEAVEKQASTDGLTGLYNRRTLDKLLPEAMARARRSGAPLTVVLTDIDFFKGVNDTYGHVIGDDVIRGISRSLIATSRASDVVARYGGEEFCLLLEGTDGAGAVRLAERARMSIKGLRFETPRGPLHVTASFGVAVLNAKTDARMLLEEADAGLYKAKQQGRDRVVLLVHEEVMP